MIEFEKSIASEKKRINDLLRSQETAIRKAFIVFLKNVRSESFLREIRKMLENNNIDAALELVESYVVSFANILPQIFQRIGIAEAASLASIFGRKVPRVAISFDPTHVRAADAIRNSRLEFIRDFTRKQRDAVRYNMGLAFEEGLNPQKTAKRFVDSIGLTATQLQAIQNYKRALERGSLDALEREMRDRRFDRTVLSAIQEETPLRPEQIERIVERYHAKFLLMRATNISRTEALRVLNISRHEALEQSIEITGLARERIIRRWNTSHDSRVRSTHQAMDGQKRGLDQHFQSPSGARLMFPGDPLAPPEEVINCRCVLTTSIQNIS